MVWLVLPLMVYVNETATATKDALDITCPKAWQKATGVRSVNNSLSIGWKTALTNKISVTEAEIFSGNKLYRINETKLTARFGKPIDQLAAQYTTPTRRCTTDTKLQKKHKYSMKWEALTNQSI